MQIRFRMAMFGLMVLILSTTVYGEIEPIKRIKVAKGPYFSALSSDGKKLFITGFVDSEIQVVDLATNLANHRFYGGFEPVGIAVSPAGDKIFVPRV